MKYALKEVFNMFKRKSKKEKFTAWDAIEELVKHDDDILEILKSQQEAIKELKKSVEALQKLALEYTNKNKAQ